MSLKLAAPVTLAGVLAYAVITYPAHVPCVLGPDICRTGTGAGDDGTTTGKNQNRILPELTPEDEIFAARTLYGEARGQDARELEAIANVIFTRWQSGKYGTTMVDVVTYSRGGSFAFSAWMPGTALFNGMMKAGQSELAPYRAIVRRVFDARIADGEDVTGGATHYYHPAAMKPAWRIPSWAMSPALKGKDAAGLAKITARLAAGEDPDRVLPRPYVNRREIGDAVFMTLR